MRLSARKSLAALLLKKRHSWSRSVEEEVYEEFGVFPFCPCLPPLLIASSLRSDTHADRVETLRERVCLFNAAHTLPGDSSVTSGRKHPWISLFHPPEPVQRDMPKANKAA